ncbi:MAG: hypothetical protein AAGI38_00475 [Bacteroidota bacterium]
MKPIQFIASWLLILIVPVWLMSGCNPEKEEPDFCFCLDQQLGRLDSIAKAYANSVFIEASATYISAYYKDFLSEDDLDHGYVDSMFQDTISGLEIGIFPQRVCTKGTELIAHYKFGQKGTEAIAYTSVISKIEGENMYDLPSIYIFYDWQVDVYRWLNEYDYYQINRTALTPDYTTRFIPIEANEGLCDTLMKLGVTFQGCTSGK